MIQYRTRCSCVQQIQRIRNIDQLKTGEWIINCWRIRLLYFVHTFIAFRKISTVWLACAYRESQTTHIHKNLRKQHKFIERRNINLRNSPCWHAATPNRTNSWSRPTAAAIWTTPFCDYCAALYCWLAGQRRLRWDGGKTVRRSDVRFPDRHSPSTGGWHVGSGVLLVLLLLPMVYILFRRSGKLIALNEKAALIRRTALIRSLFAPRSPYHWACDVHFAWFALTREHRNEYLGYH